VVSGSSRARSRFDRELALRVHRPLQRQVMECGEISQVTEIIGSSLVNWRHPHTGAPMPVVYKKMPPFLRRADAEDFVQHYREYNRLLHEEVGIAVPHYDARIVEPAPGVVRIYVVQERVDPGAVCHHLLPRLGEEAAARLYRQILREYEKLFVYNTQRAANGYQLGLDGQIPNWALAASPPDPNDLTGREPLLYLDTNVPMVRVDGRDVVSTDMYFQGLPGVARWLIKRIDLDRQVMDRYFDLRTIMLDFLGNILVRHRSDLVPRLIQVTNEALAGPFSSARFAPFTRKEVDRYYRSDVATWRLWRSLKLLGALSDGLSHGEWRVLRRVGEFYTLWTKPIF
jgi:hypothetical protein